MTFFNPAFLSAPPALLALPWQTDYQADDPRAYNPGGAAALMAGDQGSSAILNAPTALRMLDDANGVKFLAQIGFDAPTTIQYDLTPDHADGQGTETNPAYASWLASNGLVAKTVYSNSGANYSAFWQGQKIYGPIFTWHEDKDTNFGIAIQIAATAVGGGWVYTVGIDTVNGNYTGALVAIASQGISQNSASIDQFGVDDLGITGLSGDLTTGVRVASQTGSLVKGITGAAQAASNVPITGTLASTGAPSVSASNPTAAPASSADYGTLILVAAIIIAAGFIAKGEL